MKLLIQRSVRVYKFFFQQDNFSAGYFFPICSLGNIITIFFTFREKQFLLVIIFRKLWNRLFSRYFLFFLFWIAFRKLIYLFPVFFMTRKMTKIVIAKGLTKKWVSFGKVKAKWKKTGKFFSFRTINLGIKSLAVEKSVKIKSLCYFYAY